MERSVRKVEELAAAAAAEEEAEKKKRWQEAAAARAAKCAKREYEMKNEGRMSKEKKVRYVCALCSPTAMQVSDTVHGIP